MSENLRDQLQTTLGDAYTLERELGGGGMSRVFVAKDATLGREIVVKVLPHDTAAGVSAERFKREIQTAARLQHPHIVPLLSAGETGGLPFYTMPFVKGESLRARLTRSSELSVNEAIHVLRDIAAALAYAHSEGVVHRDIKPDNVILSGGVAVVTDFGVSKAVDVASTEDGGQSGLTSLGVALGTPAYMSPEQASADPHVDHRADIYSFGCVAYELLTGTSPFAGRPPQQMLAAHVKDAPESVLKRRPNVPPPLAALVMKCLQKRAGDRPQSAEELLTALDAIGTPSGGMMPTGERLTAVGRSRSLWLGVAAAALIVGVGAVALLLTPAAASYSLGATYPVAITPEIEGEPAISPDGRLVAYVAATPVGDRIFVRQVEGGRANLLTAEIEGNHAWPQWSPDQQRISFAANGLILVAPAMGGSPQRVIEGGPTHSWSRDGSQIAFESAGGIWTQSLAGGERKRLVAGTSLHSPALSPSGHALAYVDGQRLRMANVSTSAIWATQVVGGKPIRVSDSTYVNASPVWTPDGKSLLYISSLAGSRDVYQQPVRDNGAPRGAPRRVTTGLSSLTISLSADGSRMAYDAVSNHTNIWTVAIPARGENSLSSARPITRENQRIEILSVSKDGKWLAYDSDRAGNFDIYKLRLDGGEPIQITNNPGNDFGPAWSPSGAEIAFHAHRSTTRDIYIVSAEGGVERQVTSGPAEDYLPHWSPDGRKLVYYSGSPDNRQAALAVSRDAQGSWSPPARLTPETETVARAAWSPNGAALAYIRADSVPLTVGGVAGGAIVLLQLTGGAARVLASPNSLGGGSAQHLAWGPSAEVVFASVADSRDRLSIWAVPTSGGTPRRILADDATHRFGRAEFDTDGSRLYFTLAAWESDVKVADLKR